MATIAEINQAANGFSVFSWDENRGEGKDAGSKYLCTFHINTQGTQPTGMAEGWIYRASLEGLSAQQVSRVFQQFIEFTNKQDVNYTAMSIHVVDAGTRIQAQPTVHVFGERTIRY